MQHATEPAKLHPERIRHQADSNKLRIPYLSAGIRQVPRVRPACYSVPPSLALLASCRSQKKFGAIMSGCLDIVSTAGSTPQSAKVYTHIARPLPRCRHLGFELSWILVKSPLIPLSSVYSFQSHLRPVSLQRAAARNLVHNITGTVP